MSLSRRLFVLTCLAVLVPRAAAAHAVLTSAQPAHGSTIRPGAIAIVLGFNTRIDRSRSRLTLTSPDGTSTQLHFRDDSTVSILRADATVANTGLWRMRWQVLAADGHITRGDVTFTVAAS